MRDVDPPVIVAGGDTLRVGPGPARIAPTVTPPVWAPVIVSVGDHGSGVDWEALRVWLDGQPLLAEPDPPRDRVLVALPDDLAPGPHALGLEVVDRAGNHAARVLALLARS